MSRVGKRKITIPANVKVAIKDNQIDIQGPRGKVSCKFHERIDVQYNAETIEVKRHSDSKQDKALHGTTASSISNLIKGVTEGYERQLVISGVGYKAQLQGKKLILNLRFSHPVEFVVPEGIEIQIPKPNQIAVKGIDRVTVGTVAARIRSICPPEPYKGKGIRYSDEYIRRKVGKKVA